MVWSTAEPNISIIHFPPVQRLRVPVQGWTAEGEAVRRTLDRKPDPPVEALKA